MSGSDDRFRDRPGACPRCGAREMLPDAELRQSGALADTLRLLARGAPDAWLFKKRKSSKVRASVCTACGHIALRARDLDALREAYETRNALE